MTEKRPTKPFNFSTRPKQQEKAPQQSNKPEQIRDKDNAQPRIKPPAGVSHPNPRLAPPGSKGIQRNLPTNNAAKKPEQKRFALGKGGELTERFKPIVQKPPGKGPDIGR
jgi:hypothetical protein